MKKLDRDRQILFGLSELDLWHNLVLFFIIISSIFAFLYVSPSKVLQFTVGAITTVLYVAWGFVHHYYDNDLCFKNMIEYILIAVLSLMILGGVLL